MISFLIAEFIGDPNRYPFYKNQIFQIKVKQRVFGLKIDVRVTHGYDWKTYVGYDHTFYTLTDFLDNWKIKEVKADPSIARGFGFEQVERPS